MIKHTTLLQSCFLEKFPNEILLRICFFLDIPSLITVSKLNKRFFKLISTDQAQKSGLWYPHVKIYENSNASNSSNLSNQSLHSTFSSSAIYFHFFFKAFSFLKTYSSAQIPQIFYIPKSLASYPAFKPKHYFKTFSSSKGTQIANFKHPYLVIVPSVLSSSASQVILLHQPKCQVIGSVFLSWAQPLCMDFYLSKHRSIPSIVCVGTDREIHLCTITPMRQIHVLFCHGQITKMKIFSTHKKLFVGFLINNDTFCIYSISQFFATNQFDVLEPDPYLDRKDPNRKAQWLSQQQKSSSNNRSKRSQTNEKPVVFSVSTKQIATHFPSCTSPSFNHISIEFPSVILSTNSLQSDSKPVGVSFSLIYHPTHFQFSSPPQRLSIQPIPPIPPLQPEPPTQPLNAINTDLNQNSSTLPSTPQFQQKKIIHCWHYLSQLCFLLMIDITEYQLIIFNPYNRFPIRNSVYKLERPLTSNSIRKKQTSSTLTTSLTNSLPPCFSYGPWIYCPVSIGIICINMFSTSITCVEIVDNQLQNAYPSRMNQALHVPADNSLFRSEPTQNSYSSNVSSLSVDIKHKMFYFTFKQKGDILCLDMSDE